MDLTAERKADQTAAQRYDDVPYYSFPNALLQPSRFGAVAVLNGHQVADPATARVLEIGCATGGHLIPIAARMPGASFLGIDVSSVQIETGRARIATLGIGNIRLETQSITDLDASHGSFDYIICHGVFSWVPDFVREAILCKCSELLSPKGVAVISFNVLPGWRMLQVFRDSAILHCKQFSSPAEKAQNMRALFEAMNQYTAEQTTYGQLCRKELGKLTANPDFYLLHELLEDDNTPMTFTTFMGEASAHGLRYLADANLLAGIPENAGAERAALIRTLAGNDPAAIEQYTDIVLGRTFRSALLVKDTGAARSDIASNLDRLEQMHFVAALDLQLKESGPDTWSIIDAKAGEIEVRGKHAASAVQRMFDLRPSTISYAGFVGDQKDEAVREEVIHCLRRLICMGVIDASLSPLDCPSWPVANPRVWPLTLADATAGEEYSSTRRHESFKITDRARFLIRQCDGNRSLADLEDSLLGMILHGGATINENGVPISDETRLRSIVKDAVAREFQNFARVGLLV